MNMTWHVHIVTDYYNTFCDGEQQGAVADRNEQEASDFHRVSHSYTQRAREYDGANSPTYLSTTPYARDYWAFTSEL